MSGGFTRVLTLLASTVVLPFFFLHVLQLLDQKSGRLGLAAPLQEWGFFFYTPSLKGCKRMCFFMVAIAAHMQKVHSVPCLTAKHGRV